MDSCLALLFYQALLVLADHLVIYLFSSLLLLRPRGVKYIVSCAAADYYDCVHARRGISARYGHICSFALHQIRI
ncbi:hypothetical protein F4820DRAFT_427666 [Hypoxylon rubiginosum]|uniref:Uncharacterized protein n=1 Tax=Hypoxylon rubiginosum TaxID=110542 RepID=A0ACB9YUV1_9PEZI|nr:hypothetical protein F4820DRAFT_427666 [Hypoxylon rubiginosum]